MKDATGELVLEIDEYKRNIQSIDEDQDEDLEDDYWKDEK